MCTVLIHVFGCKLSLVLEKRCEADKIVILGDLRRNRSNLEWDEEAAWDEMERGIEEAFEAYGYYIEYDI